MYDLEAIRRLVKKDGVHEAMSFLSSPYLPESIKISLTQHYVFVGGYPNLSLILSLA